MGMDEYILKKDDNYIIQNKIMGEVISFGEYYTYEEAIKKVLELEEDGWPIDEEIYKKIKGNIIEDNIEKIDENTFQVFKIINDEKRIYGTYNTLEDAENARCNLESNGWESTTEFSESKYGKYISKLPNEYYMLSKLFSGVRVTFKISKDLDYLKNLRFMLIENNWDEEKIGLEINHVIFKNNEYNIFKLKNGFLEYYGSFDDIETAKEVEEFLKENNWDKSLLGLDEYEEFINFDGNKYIIQNLIAHELKTFGEYDTLEEAIIERDKLIEDNWGLKKQDREINFTFEENYPKFENLKLINSGFIKNNKALLPFTVDELLEVYDEYVINQDISSLASKHNISVSFLARIIKRFEAGDFYNIIEEWDAREDIQDTFQW